MCVCFVLKLCESAILCHRDVCVVYIVIPGLSWMPLLNAHKVFLCVFGPFEGSKVGHKEGMWNKVDFRLDG